jgi:ATP-dependent exoDNAse (exonuclease V) alpha subunit
MSAKVEHLASVGDAMHAILVKRVDQLASSIDGAADITEYMSIVTTIMAACVSAALAVPRPA